METDGAPNTARKQKKGKYSEEFKTKVVKLLEEGKWIDRRSAKLSQDDFLSLLADFNRSGIHFA